MKFLASALVLAQVQVFASVVGSAGLVAAPVYLPPVTSYVGQSSPVVFEGKLYTPPLTSVYAPVVTTVAPGQVYLPAASTAVRTTFPYTAAVPLPIASTNIVASTGFQVNAAPATAQKGQPTPWITQTFNPSLFPQATTNVSRPGEFPYTPAVPVSQTTAWQQSGARPTITTTYSPMSAVVSSSSYSPVATTFPPALSIAQSSFPSSVYVPSSAVFPPASSGITIPNSVVVPASFPTTTYAATFPATTTSASFPAATSSSLTGAASFPSAATTPSFPSATSSFTGTASFPSTAAFPASNTFNTQATSTISPPIAGSFPTFTGSANVGAASAGTGTGDDYYYD